MDNHNEDTQLMLCRDFGNHAGNTIKKAELIKKFETKLKINTVVTSLNHQENMSEIITALNSDRWKVFQVLKVEGENDTTVDPLLISEEQFMSFVNRHKNLNPIYETNNIFRDSYVRLDPLGLFFQNSKGFIEYNRSILEVDPIEASAEVEWEKEKFLKRGGLYDL